MTRKFMTKSILAVVFLAILASAAPVWPVQNGDARFFDNGTAGFEWGVRALAFILGFGLGAFIVRIWVGKKKKHRFERQEKEIFRLAMRKNGFLAMADIVVGTSANSRDAKEILEGMTSRGDAGTNVTETGVIVYEFFDLADRDYSGLESGEWNDAQNPFQEQTDSPEDRISVGDSMPDIRREEYETLANLYRKTNGDKWKNNTGWLCDSDISKWFGIECAKGRVESIRLYGNGLEGTLPDLGALADLRKLSLYQNHLEGTIPELKALTRLRELNMHNNQLTGTIPDIGTLADLRELNLYKNRLRGPLPDLSGLTRLEIIHFEHNLISGPLPRLSQMKNLRNAEFNGNRFEGNIPDLTGLGKLRGINMQDNLLTGPIPDLSTLTGLMQIMLYKNRLTGRIPDLSALKKLHTLNLFDNRLSGPVPDLSSLPKLVNLSLHDNDLCRDPKIDYGRWREKLDKFPICKTRKPSAYPESG